MNFFFELHLTFPKKESLKIIGFDINICGQRIGVYKEFIFNIHLYKISYHFSIVLSPYAFKTFNFRRSNQ